ncbi:MAG: GNAT family N-acetyltransferase [Nocardioides sp.]|uniref:GNAT family N-acetyltransferase n=1 Tax=Nocardioides sp. TaxID=35761 RepID=UPI0039E221BC
MTLRPAVAADLPDIAELYLRVRTAVVPAMPPQIHTAEEVHAYVGGWQLDQRDVWVAELRGTAVAFMVVDPGWLESLYVLPEAAGQGIGSALLDVAKRLRTEGFCLWVFESNRPARNFYTHRGLLELERTDGSGNEERAPDIKMAWPGRDPLTFLRRLVDDVDDRLGDLLAERVALTTAVQRVKATSGIGTDRDPEREHEIARRLAERAPALGEDRLARIAHAIITESLDAGS